MLVQCKKFLVSSMLKNYLFEPMKHIQKQFWVSERLSIKFMYNAEWKYCLLTFYKDENMKNAAQKIKPKNNRSKWYG